MITLYQMPLSHFCEKIRWALAHKRLPHKIKNLLPGLHIRKAKHLTGQSALPVLKEGRIAIHGSAAIIDFLDNEYPRFPLTPQDEHERDRALEWERWADDEIGPATRVLAHSVLLDHPKILKAMMGQGGPWYGSWYLDNAFPKIQVGIQRGLRLNEQNIEKAWQTLRAAQEKMVNEKALNGALVNSGFSRGDLAMASLWAPLFTIGKYGLDWPETMPPEFSNFETEFAQVEAWVKSMYSAYR